MQNSKNSSVYFSSIWIIWENTQKHILKCTHSKWKTFALHSAVDLQRLREFWLEVKIPEKLNKHLVKMLWNAKFNISHIYYVNNL